MFPPITSLTPMVALRVYNVGLRKPTVLYPAAIRRALTNVIMPAMTLVEALVPDMNITSPPTTVT